MSIILAICFCPFIHSLHKTAEKIKFLLNEEGKHYGKHGVYTFFLFSQFIYLCSHNAALAVLEHTTSLPHPISLIAGIIALYRYSLMYLKIYSKQIFKTKVSINKI